MIALTVAITDLPKVSASDSPVARILNEQLGPAAERVLLVTIATAFFGAGLVSIAATGRIVFTMARDARFPAHGLMRRVSPRTRTPIPATIVVLLLGIGRAAGSSHREHHHDV